MFIVRTPDHKPHTSFEKRKQDDGDDWGGVVSVDPDSIEFVLPPVATDSPAGLRTDDFKVTHRRIPATYGVIAEVDVAPCFEQESCRYVDMLCHHLVAWQLKKIVNRSTSNY